MGGMGFSSSGIGIILGGGAGGSVVPGSFFSHPFFDSPFFQ